MSNTLSRSMAITKKTTDTRMPSDVNPGMTGKLVGEVTLQKISAAINKIMTIMPRRTCLTCLLMRGVLCLEFNVMIMTNSDITR
ncbi:hypothetical protein D3C78_538100 [compost metagenome]